MHVIPHIALLTTLLATLLPTSATAKSPDRLREEFMAEMVAEHGFDPVALKRVLWQAEVRKPILEAIARPAEKRLNWGEYRQLFVGEDRISGGIRFWAENGETLQRAEAEYGVPAEIIVAIIGVETRYGSHKGRFPVLDALHTLGFHYPPRGEFFRSELKHFLLLAREEGLDPTRPTGSYAGAMGYPQFISSSYRHYAVDFDGDGKRNIWTDTDDAIGSVANYFARHGWTNGAPVIFPVQGVTDEHRDMLDMGLKPTLKLGDLHRAGIKSSPELSEDTPVSLLAFETAEGTEYWAGLNNFYVITRYNHSPLYAMAVYQLSLEIRKGHEQQAAR